MAGFSWVSLGLAGFRWVSLGLLVGFSAWGLVDLDPWVGPLPRGGRVSGGESLTSPRRVTKDRKEVRNGTGGKGTPLPQPMPPLAPLRSTASRPTTHPRVVTSFPSSPRRMYSHLRPPQPARRRMLKLSAGPAQRECARHGFSACACGASLGGGDDYLLAWGREMLDYGKKRVT